MLRYHNITTDDMKNGEGLRTVLWLAGCGHHCKGCHNPITWSPDGGIPFDEEAKSELIEDLKQDYISGLTLSGGDPLYLSNRDELLALVRNIKSTVAGKTIWLYTGYTWEDLIQYEDYTTHSILEFIDVLVDGRFEEDKKDTKYPWAGSTNQRVIDVQKSLEKGEVILYECH